MKVNENVVKPFPEFTGCESCGSIHVFIKEKCPVCNLCFPYCVRDIGCKWYNGSEMPQPKMKIEDADNNDAPKKAEIVANVNIREAFESWLVSTNCVKLNLSMEESYKEFEIFLKEILTAVDVNRTYFAIEEDSKGEVKFKKLDSTKLHKNDSGDYVIVEGRKRIRIGKSVAVL